MDSKKLNMVMTILKFVLVIIGVVACFMVILGPNGEADIEAQEKFMDSFSLGLAINYTLYIILGGVAVILVFFLIQLVTTTKKTALSIVGVLAALIVYLIFWAGGSTDTNESLALTEKVAVEQETIGTVTAGIYTVLTGLTIAVLATRIGQIRSVIRYFQGNK